MENKQRRVMIGTPCYDGRLDVWYVNSLCNTIKLAAAHNVHITPMWVSFDALIQRARNDTLKLALEGGYDDLIWIDSDIEWEPEWFFKLLQHEVDIVGGTYRKKGDTEEYVMRGPSTFTTTTGLDKVTGLGTGFVRMSRAALQHLWDVSPSYTDAKDGEERRMAFQVQVVGDSLMSEDIWAFQTLTAGGFKIWLDTSMTCNHTGPYKFKGDYMSFKKRGYPNGVKTAPAVSIAPKERPVNIDTTVNLMPRAVMRQL